MMLITVLILGILLVAGGLFLSRKNKKIFIPLLLLLCAVLAGMIAFGAAGNQKILFRPEVYPISFDPDEPPRKALEFSLPLDEEALMSFEEALFDLPGPLMGYRIQWEEDWYEYALTPQPAGLGPAVDNGQYVDSVIRIYQTGDTRTFLRVSDGLLTTDATGPDLENLRIRRYEWVINRQGDVTDPDQRLERYQKEIEELLDRHFDREYRQEYPW